MSTTILLTIILSALTGSVLTWVIVNSKKLVAEKLLDKLTSEKEQLDLSYKALQAEVHKTLVDISALKTQLHYKDEKLELQKQEIENIGNKFEAQFKVLANNILEDKSRKFSEQQEVNLKAILEPLRQNISAFKQEFDVRYNDETKERSSLKEQIRNMMDLNKTLSDQANNLTNALRGQVKQQGNWGEMILESILEHAGLKKNMQYFVQQSSQNQDGRTIQPDVIVKYPDERVIVIDAKVSLVHYENYTIADNDEARSQSTALLIRSIKNHIDILGSKAYHDVNSSLDFVLMFVPVEAAYITAMQADTALWQYAYAKRVLLLSPTNLIAAMKLVSDMWQRDAVSKEAQTIADKANKMYEKLVGFVENFERVGTQLEKAHTTWQDAFKQLSKGKGNLVSQAEQIRRFKTNTNKNLPASMVEDALIEDGIDDEEQAKNKPA